MQIFVLLVSVATVGLWCANGALADVFGEMGIIAVLPMVAFFGFGVLGKACPSRVGSSLVKRFLSGYMRGMLSQVAIATHVLCPHIDAAQ